MVKKINKFKRIGLVLVFLLVFSSCERGQRLYKKKFLILGTFVEVTSPSPEAGEIVYKEMKKLEKIFNDYDANSIVSRLSRQVGNYLSVPPQLIELVELSKKVYQMSEGVFDPSCGRLYHYWKSLIKKKKISQLPSKKEIEEIKNSCGMEQIKVDRENNKLLLQKKDLLLDFGGIAKGYIVDKAVLKLKKAGIKSALVNAGGDIYCLGTKFGKPWRVGVQDPSGGILDTVLLQDEAIATSGNYEQFFDFKGKKYSHIVNPKTGYPVRNNILSVSVVAGNATTADAFATTFFILGPEGIKKFLGNYPSTMKIFVLTKEKGKRHYYIFK